MQIKPTARFKNIDDYHSVFPDEAVQMMQELRALIKQAAPQAEEVISYNMPAFRLGGILVYYGGAKAHIGFYPTSKPIVFFKDELSNYKTSKGAIQFPIGEPIPKTLVKKIVKFRIAEEKERALAKNKKKKT